MSTKLEQAPSKSIVSEPVRQSNYSTNFLNPLLATPTLQYSDNRQKLSELKELFNYRFSLYEELFACMTEKAYFKRADKLRHPLIFYYGHTAVFFMNKLIVSGVLSPKDRINPYFEQVMAIGVDEMSWDDLLSADYEWPAVSEVKGYRDLVRKVVNDVIDNKILIAQEGIITWENKLWVVLMGIEHEAIHLETSAVLIRQLPLEVLIPYPESSVFNNDFRVTPTKPEDVSPFGFITVPESEVTLGRPFSLENADSENKSNYVPIYGWDNEFGKHSFTLKEFHLADRLVSNADFLHFVNDKCYEAEQFWSTEGWKWVQFTKTTKPLFWVSSSEGAYSLRKTASIEDHMPWSWPVEINSLEATAFLRYYKQKHNLNVRLPSEAEYHTVLNQTKYFQETNNKIFPQDFNIALRYSSSCPNHLYKQGDFFDLVGNVWQWTNTTMYPYKGFKVHPTYDDFTEPTFDDRHNLFKGGSWVSISNEANIFCRYAFRRHFFQFAGLRVALSQEPSEIQESINMNDCSSILPLESAISQGNPYETDELANQYCEQHYGPQVLPYFERHTNVCARLCEHLLLRLQTDPQKSRILDLGCGVGRTTFELGRNFGAAVGVDFSTRFIQVAVQLKENGRIRYKIPIEGEIYEFREAAFDSESFHLTQPQESSLIKSLFGDLPSSFTEKKPLEEIISKVNFLQADACNLSQTHRLLKENFDIILFSNVLDRLYDPLAFLNSVHQRIVPGGFLVITSPYTWLASYVSQQNWIGGFKRDGENVFSVENLKCILGTWFEIYVFSPADQDYKDSFKMQTSPQNRHDQHNPHNAQQNTLSSFHMPAISRETLRKYELIYSECSIWRRKTI